MAIGCVMFLQIVLSILFKYVVAISLGVVLVMCTGRIEHNRRSLRQCCSERWWKSSSLIWLTSISKSNQEFPGKNGNILITYWLTSSSKTWELAPARTWTSPFPVPRVARVRFKKNANKLSQKIAIFDKEI